MADYAKRMLESVAAFEHISSVKGVTDQLEKVIGSFGYSAYLVTGVPEPPRRLEEYILMNGWPSGWSEHYGKNDYYRFDPVAAQCRKTTNPFEWSEVAYDPVRDTKAAEVMNVARDFGMRKGFLVPIVTTSGFQACVTMAGEYPDLDPDAKRVLHVVSLFAHGKITNLHASQVKKTASLSKNEREVLAWSALGKSSLEISVITGLSKLSVDTFAKRAMLKLNATTRTQAVVNAIFAREIIL